MTAFDSASHWPLLRRAARTVVVVDVVESVRLMEQDQDDFIRRWLSFVAEVQTALLPQHGGRLVKSLGDGLMLEFDAVPPAIQCALAMHSLIAQGHSGRSPEQRMYLRAGAHLTDVVVDERDIYGAGVNLAARIATLAGPGEIVVSADVRDALTEAIDAHFDDRGECHLKHIHRPVRAYGVSAVRPTVRLPSPEPVFAPMIAVIPFDARLADDRHHAIGELIADVVIVALSRSPNLRVVSRLSTRVLSGRDTGLQEAGHLLGATYVLRGGYSVVGELLVTTAELVDTRKSEIVWADMLRVPLADLLQPESELAYALSRAITESVERSEVVRAITQPLPTLESFTLQLGAVVLMHRASPREFARVHELLEHLIDRHPKLPTPRAWLAKWHVLRVTRNLVADADAEAQAALEHTRRALDSDPDCPLALAMEGFVHCHMKRDLAAAARRYERALASNPNESIAWLFKGVMHAFQGQGEDAITAADRAISLSPMDPLRYYYDSLAASAALSARRYEQAESLALRSLRGNRMHTSTWRVLVMSQALNDRVDDARRSAAELLRLDPGFTVGNFLARSPSADFEIGRLCAAALRRAGVPS